jgi:hypothetical protein
VNRDTQGVVAHANEETYRRNKTHRQTLTLNGGANYEFSIFDSLSQGNGDGIAEPGYYIISLGGDELKRGGRFEDAQSTMFEVSNRSNPDSRFSPSATPSTKSFAPGATPTPTSEPVLAETSTPTFYPTQDTVSPTKVGVPFSLFLTPTEVPVPSFSSSKNLLRQRETWFHDQGIQDSGRSIYWPSIQRYDRLARLSQE